MKRINALVNLTLAAVGALAIAGVFGQEAGNWVAGVVLGLIFGWNAPDIFRRD